MLGFCGVVWVIHFITIKIAANIRQLLVCSAIHTQGAGVNIFRTFGGAVSLVAFDYVQAHYITKRRYGQFGQRS